MGLMTNQNTLLEAKGRTLGEESKTSIMALDLRIKDLEQRNALLME